MLLCSQQKQSNGLKIAARSIQLDIKAKHPTARMTDPWNRLLWEGGRITGASDPQDKHLSRAAIAELAQGRLGDLRVFISNDLLGKPIEERKILPPFLKYSGQSASLLVLSDSEGDGSCSVQKAALNRSSARASGEVWWGC